MEKKITGEEWKRIIFQQFLEAIKGILDESTDISKACVIVHNFICGDDRYCKEIDEKDSLYLTGIWSELGEFPKGETRQNYTPEELSALDLKEKEKVEWYKKDLQDICRKILASDIIKMGPPPEDPLSWPYPDGI